MIKTSPGTDTIEEDVRASRRDIDDDTRRIRQRLSPGDVIDSVLGFARDNGGAVAGGVGRTVRDHPLPLAMIGAGIVWLALSGRADSDEDDWEAEQYGDYSGAGAAQRESMGHKLRHRASSMREGASERAAEMRERAGERAAEMRERAGELGHRARAQASRAGRTGGRFVKDHPVLIGAVGVALGAALAASLPRTSREDDTFGARAERARQAARRAAVAEGRKVQEAAKSAVEKARETGERKAPTADDLKRDVEETAKAATGSSGTTPGGTTPGGTTPGGTTPGGTTPGGTTPGGTTGAGAAGSRPKTTPGAG